MTDQVITAVPDRTYNLGYSNNIITDLCCESHLGLHTSPILLTKGFVEFFYFHF